MTCVNPDWIITSDTLSCSQMARKMKVAGTELSEEEIEDMLEQGR